MAKICQVSGKRANNAKHIRNQHSQGWKYKAPHKNRTQSPNLQVVRLKTPNGVVRLKVEEAKLQPLSSLERITFWGHNVLDVVPPITLSSLNLMLKANCFLTRPSDILNQW